jgi:hypothetical protein
VGCRSQTTMCAGVVRGAVKDKHARFNLCFADEGHEPDYVRKDQL